MVLIESLFIYSLYKVTEKIWEKSFDAAWEPVGEGLKERFFRWAGKDKESQRQAAFAAAADSARKRTIRQAPGQKQAERVLQLLDQKTDSHAAMELAEEAAKLMLFSDEPNVEWMTAVVQKRFHWDEIWAGEPRPSDEAVIRVLTLFLTNLREVLLDQEIYENLVNKEILRVLRRIASQLGADVANLPALEADYKAKLAEKYKYLTMEGISPKVQNRTIGVRMKDVFIPLKATDDDFRQKVATALEEINSLIDEVGGLESEPLAHWSPDELLRWVSEQRDFLKDSKHRGLDVGSLYADLQKMSLLAHLPKSGKVELDALTDFPRAVVQGDPGNGKSTLMRYIAWALATGQDALVAERCKMRLPMLIRAVEFGEALSQGRVNSLDEYLLHEANRFAPLVSHKLYTGEAYVLIDGLDEIGKVGLRGSPV